MGDRIDDFIVEAREHLGIVEGALLALERNPPPETVRARIDECFRAIHSLKGDAGFLGIGPIRELAHAMETVLDGLHEPISATVIETLFAARDRLAVLVDDVRSSHPVEVADLLARLRGLPSTPPLATFSVEFDLATIPRDSSSGLVAAFEKMLDNATVDHGTIALPAGDLRRTLAAGPVMWSARVRTPLSQSEWLAKLPAKPRDSIGRREPFEIDLTVATASSQGLRAVFAELASFCAEPTGTVTFPPVNLAASLPVGPVIWNGECATTHGSQAFQQRLGKITRAVPPMIEDRKNSREGEAPTEPKESIELIQRGSSGTSPSPSEKSGTLRIHVELLDRLMNLVGELTLVRNQSLLAFADESGTQPAIIQRLNSVTSDLQDTTLRARMQPVGNLFNKFPRMVRDLARQLGKEIDIELVGRDVELDKTILERLSDPLTHLVRNCVDHGIESPADRIAKGKSPTGKIILSARHEDGLVQILIHDDGRGIDADAVKAKALSSRLKSAAELERMTPQELFALILLPGFSTARQVTEVSGRGVGMDVVKTNIEQLEGTLSIDSVAGQGCSMALRLPLTLAIIPSLIVQTDGERYAIPQRDLEEVVCLHPQATGRIELALDAEVYRLRGQLVPVVRSRNLLRRPLLTAVDAIQYLLILRADGRRFGLVVDAIQGSQEIVVKPLHPVLKRIAVFSGATILGDGRITLIVNVPGIVEHARLSFEATRMPANSASAPQPLAQTHRVLLFEYGPHEQFALPLLQIRRIELLGANPIERVGNDEFVTVDGVSTRILRLNQVLQASAPESTLREGMALILPKFTTRPVGILVSRIIDTESLAIDLQEPPADQPGILGTAIVRNRLTSFLDLHQLIRSLFGDARGGIPSPSRSSRDSKRLLLIDDTAFFREVVKRYFAAEGHSITTAVNGADGLAILDGGNEFDLIVSDIEMPVMDGWEFAREVRRRQILTPLLALTSLSGRQYELKAKECGFDAYEEKLDHPRLVKKVAELLAAGSLVG